MKPYSQLTAFSAIVSGSIKALVRSPATIFFSIAFPVIFIFIFGSISNESTITFKVGVTSQSDTSNNPIYTQLVKEQHIYLVGGTDEEQMAQLKEGKLLAILKIKKNQTQVGAYKISFISSTAGNSQNVETFKSQILKGIIAAIDEKTHPASPTIATIEPVIVSVPGRQYKTIDFILPGQLGFSLMSLGILSIAMVIFNLRKNLIFKRLFATPVKPFYLLLGEVLSRLLFQTLAVIIIIGIGVHVFGFSLANGAETFMNMLTLSLLALIVFMGLGLLIGTSCNNENAVSPIANMLIIPQLMLAGSFFDIENFPPWLRPVCRILPLSYFNHSMRQISFNGISLWACRYDIIPLLIWGIALYGISAMRFRWE